MVVSPAALGRGASISARDRHALHHAARRITWPGGAAAAVDLALAAPARIASRVLGSPVALPPAGRPDGLRHAGPVAPLLARRRALP